MDYHVMWQLIILEFEVKWIQLKLQYTQIVTVLIFGFDLVNYKSSKPYHSLAFIKKPRASRIQQTKLSGQDKQKVVPSVSVNLNFTPIYILSYDTQNNQLPKHSLLTDKILNSGIYPFLLFLFVTLSNNAQTQLAKQSTLQLTDKNLNSLTKKMKVMMNTLLNNYLKVLFLMYFQAFYVIN